jgi:hypothetical protein
MLNYNEIVTQASEHRSFLLANAEQQRLAHSLVPGQPHPLRAWIGQRLIALGQQLQGERQEAPLATPTLPVSR